MKKIKKRQAPDTNPAPFSDDLHPLLQQLYVARGIQSPNELVYEFDQLLPYHDLKQIEAAATHLVEAILQNERILIVGDFDADGATSSALAVSALKKFGAREVEFLVPNRFTYGYGLTPEIVEVAAKWKPDVIVTVDNGISSIAGVKAANERGIKVIITDHHLAGNELPNAAAIVNPNQPGDTFASKNLAGVGVIFYLLLAVRANLREQNWFSEQNLPEPNMGQFLDLVALGTVADVVTLDKNNRLLVQQGLRRIRAGKCRPGITALLSVANRNQAHTVAADLGFAVGPRLNAAGRLDDMALGISCLLSDDPKQAKSMAIELDTLNKERRAIEAKMKDQAMQLLEKIDLENNAKEVPVGVCLYDASWHQGVVGILASRIKERLNRPVIAFAKVSDDELKGSARSITGLHIRDVLDAIATKHPGLIDKFGGHAMAAGLSLAREKLAAFSEAFVEEIAKQLDPEKLLGEIISDGALEPENLNLDVAEMLRQAGPWGQGFPEPLFDGTFRILQQRIVGGKHLRMVLGTQDPSVDVEAIAFHVDVEKWPNHDCENVNIVYRLDVNEYLGRRKVQLLVDQLEATT